MNEQTSRRGILERVPARKRRHLQRSRTYRVSFAVAGFLFVALGFLLSLPLVPGPGVPLIVIALAMLALEFDWAERLLERMLRRIERLRGQTGPLEKTAGMVALAVILAALVVVALLWDVPLLPV